MDILAVLCCAEAYHILSLLRRCLSVLQSSMADTRRRNTTLILRIIVRGSSRNLKSLQDLVQGRLPSPRQKLLLVPSQEGQQVSSRREGRLVRLCLERLKSTARVDCATNAANYQLSLNRLLLLVRGRGIHHHFKFVLCHYLYYKVISCN